MYWSNTFLFGRNDFFVDFSLLDSIVNCFVGSVRFVTKDINFGTTYRMNSFEIENPCLYTAQTRRSLTLSENGRASPCMLLVPKFERRGLHGVA